MNPKVDAFLERTKAWKSEFEALRALLLKLPLDEDLKWGQPCYTDSGRNIVLMHGFKEYCALLFFKGSLLQDPDGILVAMTDNTQSARQIRFTSVEEIRRMKKTLKKYVEQAIAIEQAGLKVVFKPTTEFQVPEEFQTRLDTNRTLKKAFESLTPGRQRAYLLHFSGAKQSATRAARVEKNMSRILEGKGLDD